MASTTHLALLLSLLCLVDARLVQIRAKRETQKQAVKDIDGLEKAIVKAYGSVGTEGIIRTLNNAKTEVSSSTAFSNVNADNIKGACEGLISALPKLMSNDSVDVIMGITTALTGITALAPPPYGTALSAIFSVSTGLIGVATGKNKGMGQIMEEALKKYLTEARVNELQDEIEGAKEVIENAMTLLNSYRGEDHSKSTPEQRAFELNFIGQQIKLRDGLPILGKLISMIKRHANTGKGEDVPEVLSLARAYAPLATVRMGLLTTLFWVYTDSDATRTVETSIQQIVARDMERNRRLFDELFVEAPTKYAHVKSKFDKTAEENKVMVTYMKDIGLDLDGGVLAEGCYQLYSVDKPDHLWQWYQHTTAFISDYNVELSAKSAATDSRTKFKFTEHSGLYTMKTSDPTDASWDGWLWSYENPTGILEVYNTGVDEQRNPGKGYLFKVTKVGEMVDTFYIVNMDYPDYPLVHDTKPIAKSSATRFIFAKGSSNPGQSAYWKFQKVGC